MKTKEVSIELQLDDGQVLPEVQCNGKTYVVGSAGKNFNVVVTTHQPAHRTVLVFLTVDGISAGISWLLTGSYSHAITGVVTDARATGEGHLKRFQFSTAQTLPTGAPAQNLEFDVGKISLRVVHVVQGTPRQAYQDIVNQANIAAVPKLNEGKKWFVAPSLQATTGGPVTRTHMNWSPYHWHVVKELGTVSLRYETACILQLRKILDPSRSDHKRLIDDCLQQEAEEALARQPQGEASSSGSAPADPNVVDLTQHVLVPVKEEPNIAERMGLAPDEIPACDLTGEDDAAPVWQAVKKQRIAID